MSNNYLKVGKLYTLDSSTDVAIAGASFIHAIHSNHQNTATITIDGTYTISLGGYSFTNFNVPVAFSTIKITNNASATIIYS